MKLHILLISLIVIFSIMALAIKKYHVLVLVPGAKKHREEIDMPLICKLMGNLYLLIAGMLLVCEIGEWIYPGFLKIFIWISVIPIAVYVRLAMSKIMK